jgi:Family of unknown function (DUF6454)
MLKLFAIPALAALVILASPPPGVTQSRPSVADAMMRLSRTSTWTLERSVPMTFTTHHPQGMVKIGERLFISSVEVRVPTKRGANRADGYDRDTGEGVGHLFEATLDGKLVADEIVGEGTMYHPGGIDYDGKFIWMTVAEYRPNSRSIAYRLDPATRKAAEMFRFGDHLGGIVHNTDDNTLHAVSWGSRWFYRFTLDTNGRVTNANARPETIRTANPSHYVDYQDCKYVGGRRMLCSGIADVPRSAGERQFQLGGIDLIDLRSGTPLHQVPVGLTTPSGVSLTRNPSWIETTDNGLRAYFLPEDDKSTLYIYAIGSEAG